MALLKKSDILKGINDPEKVHIESLDGEVWLRPLSSSELNEIDNIETKAFGFYETNNTSRMRGKTIQSGESLQKGKINVEKMNKAQNEAIYLMIYKSLDNPKNEDDPWEMEDLEKLKRYQIEELHEQVQKLSGVDVSESDVKDFPENE